MESPFDNTTRRNDDGRFVVQLSYKNGLHNKGLSKANAMKRFFRLEYITTMISIESIQPLLRKFLTLDSSNSVSFLILQTIFASSMLLIDTEGR